MGEVGGAIVATAGIGLTIWGALRMKRRKAAPGVARRVHLIGICGTAMATLAALLRSRGYAVGGSDQHVYPPMSEFLVREGIPAREGFDAAHITDDIDLVVVGNAISRGNPELEAVLERRVRYCSLPEAIRRRTRSRCASPAH